MKLSIKNLSVEIQHKSIIKGINLDVREGEFFALLGPSGCGKSTLLKTIAGILQAQSGSILLGNRDITGEAPHKRGTVIVFQDIRLFPNMTVLDNIAYPLKMQGVPRAERRAAAKSYLERVQLAGFENRRPSEMSGGQQQRVALARALAAKPSVLLLDEPFSSLDENLSEDMAELVLDLHREYKITSIFVTHNQEEALSMADRIALMFDGRIAQIGTPEEVFANPADANVEEYFQGCNYIRGTVRDGVFVPGTADKGNVDDASELKREAKTLDNGSIDDASVLKRETKAPDNDSIDDASELKRETKTPDNGNVDDASELKCETKAPGKGNMDGFKLKANMPDGEYKLVFRSKSYIRDESPR